MSVYPVPSTLHKPKVEYAAVPLHNLSERIVEKYNTKGYDQAFIYGQQGSGKTTYMVQAVYGALYIIAEDKGGTITPAHLWEEVRKAITFAAYEQLVPRIYELETSRVRLPVIPIDDAGVGFSKYLWFMGKDEQEIVMLMQGIENLIRDNCGAMILTSPSVDIMKPMRESVWLIGKPLINRNQQYPRRIELYERNRPPWNIDKLIAKGVISDKFPLWMPEFLRNWLDEKRHEVKMGLLNRMMDKLNQEGMKSEVNALGQKTLFRYSRHMAAVCLYLLTRSKLAAWGALTDTRFLGLEASPMWRWIKEHNDDVQSSGKCKICEFLKNRYYDRLIPKPSDSRPRDIDVSLRVEGTMANLQEAQLDMVEEGATKNPNPEVEQAIAELNQGESDLSRDLNGNMDVPPPAVDQNTPLWERENPS